MVIITWTLDKVYLLNKSRQTWQVWLSRPVQLAVAENLPGLIERMQKTGCFMKNIPEASRQTRILYVEDNFGLATLVQRRLARRGYAVDLANNGEEGLSSLEKGEYDIVIMDYMMPVMDGLEMLK
ncbi:MAG: response regulator, partial [Gammaproteobacteria bacterium]|nr:response regulator [Gammaproteobacteria bacterium]